MNNNNREHYTPNQAAVTSDKTRTKLSMIYDASAKKKRKKGKTD